MRIKFLFVFLMICLSALTVLKYREISYIKSNSREFVFVVQGDENKINNLKADLQGMTYQPVDEEKIEEGKYKLKIRCPPEKINAIRTILSMFALREVEDE